MRKGLTRRLGGRRIERHLNLGTCRPSRGSPLLWTGGAASRQFTGERERESAPLSCSLRMEMCYSILLIS